VRELADVAQVKLANVHRDMGHQLMDMFRQRDNPEWLEIYRRDYAEAQAAMCNLVDANFDWPPKWWRPLI
jgi:hypothetical protein